MVLIDTILNNRFFTVRNSLLGILAIFLLIILVQSGTSMNAARTQSNQADLTREVNEIIDELTLLNIAISEQRTAANTGYGFNTPAPASIIRRVNENHKKVTSSINAVLDKVQDFDAFMLVDGDEKESAAEALAQVRAAYEDYAETHSQIIKDLNSDKEKVDPDDMFAAAESLREYSGRKVYKLYNELIDAITELGNAIESDLAPDNSRLAAAARLKSHLWTMIDYSGREAASIGQFVASGAPINSDNQIILATYLGKVEGSWDEIGEVLKSDLVNDQIRRGEKQIHQKFHTDFLNEKYRLYDAANEYDPANEKVAYHVSGEQWLDLSSEAVAPILDMNGNAAALASVLNKDAVSDANGDLLISIINMIIVLLISAAAGWMILTRIVRPVNNIADTMTELAKGNLEENIPHSERLDEIGAMARSVQVFKENAVDRIRIEEEQRHREEEARVLKAEEEAKTRQEQEQRRLDREESERLAREERRSGMLELADGFEASVMKVVDSVGQSANEMETAASAMTGTAEETSSRADVVAQAAHQASSNAQMVASAAEELSASVREITGQTNQSSAAAREAVSKTDLASADISNLADAAQKIGDVVNLINDIAEQTNLLALNATIEAARAGDAGKGFAVVASEVKSLATQTGRATQEISEQVNGMQSATNTAVSAMSEIRDIIRNIETTAVSIASAVEEQDASTQEIARNVGEVSTGTEEVTSNIQDVHEGATTTGATAGQVLSAAQSLSSQSSDLKTEVEQFLANIRS